MKVLVTGGAGYIGSHTCVELLNRGHEVIVVDNLCNSSKRAITRVEEITKKNLSFYNYDILNKTDLEKIFVENKVDVVIHFAALKAVGESVELPLKYYHNNITGTLTLLEVMKKHKVKKIVFSSSATVYGQPKRVPITEDFPLSATNPYGRTKLMMEEILKDMYVADKEFEIILLRYFNPVGAHQSGLIGEDPNGIPNNLFPYISQVAVNKLKFLNVFGNDYPTKDGTGVRDYIHVVDLAKGHVKALEKFSDRTGVLIYNLGTGNGYSVLEIIRAFEKASGKKIPYKIIGRRAGDIAECYADPSKAQKELGWKASLGIEEMCISSWKWQTMNPDGYNFS